MVVVLLGVLVVDVGGISGTSSALQPLHADSSSEALKRQSSPCLFTWAGLKALNQLKRSEPENMGLSEFRVTQL